jgi:hypothetical protein
MDDAPIFDVDETVVLEATFTGTAPPGDVSLYVEDPNGSVTLVSATSDDPDIWYGEFIPAIPGDHYYRFAGTDPARSVEQGHFVVRIPRAVPA